VASSDAISVPNFKIGYQVHALKRWKTHLDSMAISQTYDFSVQEREVYNLISLSFVWTTYIIVRIFEAVICICSNQQLAMWSKTSTSDTRPDSVYLYVFTSLHCKEVWTSEFCVGFDDVRAVPVKQKGILYLFQ